MKLILIRGPSGTGKSTIARRLAEGYASSVSFHETDNFFVEKDGVYRFDAAKIGMAHAWNQNSVREKMLCQTECVIVSNTFIKHWEAKPYLDLADELGYEVEIIRTPGPWDAKTLFKRNKHSVPMAVIERQIGSYKPFENEREWTDMEIFK